MSRVSIVPVATRSELRRFIRLTSTLQATYPGFVAPLGRDGLDALSAGRNPYFEHAEARCFLAVRGGRDVGRISAQVDRLVQDERIGHFGLIAGEDDAAVFGALCGAAEAWLRERGRSVVQGPFNPSTHDPAGLLIKGFNTPPMVCMPHDPPYAGYRLQEQGYTKAVDAIAYLYDVRRALPAAARRLVDRPRADLRVRQFAMQHCEAEFDTMIGILNEACSGQRGFVPITPAEARHLATRLRPLLDPALTAIVEQRGRPIGAGIVLLNRNELIRDFRGSLLPLNFIRLMWRSRSGPRSGRAPLLCIRPGCRQGLAAGVVPWIIIDSLRKGAMARGMRDVELSLIPEDNQPMRRIAEAMGSDPYKTCRLYSKSLA